MYILGISKGHDANAALVGKNGIISAAQEERFTRNKHYCGMPVNAIKFVISHAGIRPKDIDYIALPERNDIDNLRFYVADNLNRLGIRRFKKIVTIDHHLAHAASAYRTSGWDEATVITLDGMGDGLSGTVYHCSGGKLNKISEIGTNASLGWFYSAVTEALGFRPNDEEGKTMGLAAYGEVLPPLINKLKEYVPRQRGLTLKRDASWGASGKDVNHFYRCHFDESREIRKLAREYGRKNVAACAQALIEKVVVKIAKKAIETTGCGNLAVAGGLFYNVKLNMALEMLPCVNEIRPHPAAGDSGLSIGAALEVANMFTKKKMLFQLENAYLGPEFTARECIAALKRKKVRYRRVSFGDLAAVVSGYLSSGMAVGWFQGKMEYGPRALGARSVLADPRNVKAKNRLNRKLKRREWFMPFAPTILAEHANEYICHPKPITSPFMLKAFKTRRSTKKDIAAAIHVDGTVRAQTLTRSQNPLYYDIISRFYHDTSVPAVLNTSFNRHGLPMVCTPLDAIEHLEMGCVDVLVMNNIVVEKAQA